MKISGPGVGFFKAFILIRRRTDLSSVSVFLVFIPNAIMMNYRTLKVGKVSPKYMVFEGHPKC